MRSHCAIYVDVGYLLAASATRVTGTSLRRGVQVDHPQLIKGLMETAEAESGLPLLRVNWYDSGARPGGMPDFVQDEIGLLPRVKLRLGRLSHAGEQKGVDLRIGLDLATHGRNRVVDVIYLVSGDDDLTEAVEEAQGHGVQVILLAVPMHDGRPHGVARHLQRASDGLVLIDGEIIDEAVRSRSIPEELVPEEYKTEDEGQCINDAADEHGDESSEGTEGERPEAALGDAAPDDVVPSTETGTDGTDDDAGTHPNTGDTPSHGFDTTSPDHHTTEASPFNTANDSPQPATDQGGEQGEEATHTTSQADAPQSGEPVSTGPSPAIFARKQATTVIPPPEPVWTSATGAPSSGSFADLMVDPELIDTVARQVIKSWCATATPAALAELKDQRPAIPSDLDRAMLVDLSARSGQYDIDEESRYELRHRFWRLIDQIKLT